MPNSNCHVIARRNDEAISSNRLPRHCERSEAISFLHCKISKTYHGPRFTPVGKQTPCDHHDTRVIEGYSSSPRGRIDAEVCNACDEVVNQQVIR